MVEQEPVIVSIVVPPFIGIPAGVQGNAIKLRLNESHILHCFHASTLSVNHPRHQEERAKVPNTMETFGLSKCKKRMCVSQVLIQQSIGTQQSGWYLDGMCPGLVRSRREWQ